MGILYGDELFIRDAAAEGGSPVNLNAAVAAIYSPVMMKPGVVRAFGFRVTTVFYYNTATALGILTLYKYARSIKTIAVAAAGTGYAVGDQFSITQTGATGGIGVVTSITAATGAVTGVALRPFGQGILPPDSAGVNYTAASGLATVALTGAGNNALTVTISDKVALGTLSMTDALAAGKVVLVNVANQPTPAVPQLRGPAIFSMGQTLAIEITTQALGGSYPSGAYQPFIQYHNIGTSGMQSQPLVVDQTVPITGSYGQVG